MTRHLRFAWTLLRRVVAYELLMYTSLVRWIFRWPPRIVASGERYPYMRPVAAVLWVFIVVSAIEVPILHLVLPWQAIRLTALALGVWGVLWMVGFMASLRVHPHVVDAAGLHIRCGSRYLTIPWTNIESARRRDRGLPSNRNIDVEETARGSILSAGVGGQTNVDIRLREPVVVPVPRTKGEPVAELRFAVDEPRDIVAAIDRHLTAWAEPAPDRSSGAAHR